MVRRGGRSRSGKLLPPKYGLLRYLVDAVENGGADDLMLMPVSTTYERGRRRLRRGDERDHRPRVPWARPRLFVSERNDPGAQRLSFPWNDLRPRTYGMADVVTANSRGALDALAAYVPRDRLRFVPDRLPRLPGTELPREPNGTSPPNVLILGRLHHQKAHDVFLAAFAALRAELDAWRLTIVGRGEEEDELRRLAAALGIADRVDWYGAVDDPSPHYLGADVFVLPSRHEGMPNALLEAMAFGLPVIVSDASPGPLGVVTDDESGLVVRVGDVAGLASAIIRLAKDANLRTRLADAVRRAVSPYDLENALQRWEEVLGTAPPGERLGRAQAAYVRSR